MKTLGFSPRGPSGALPRWLFIALLACATPAGLLGSSSPGVSLEAPDLYESQPEPHLIRVHYPGDIAVASLGEGDLWIVSRNGYNELAGLVEVIETDWSQDGQDPSWNEPGPDGSIRPDFWPRVTAVYSVPAPREEGWNETDNGSYSVLLEPGEVWLQSGWEYAADLLGSFRVRIGEPVPDLPGRTEIEVIRENGSVFAQVRLFWPTTGHEVDWGEVEMRGETLWVDLTITGAGEADAPEIQEHRYDLTGLEPGVYRFAVTSDGSLLASREIWVHMPEPFPASADLSVRIDDDGSAVLHAVVLLYDPYYVVSDPGTAVLDGDVFRISATAERVVFIQEPEFPGVFEADYRLGQLEPGSYRAVFELNGFPIGETAFWYDPDGPDPDGVSAGLDLDQEGDNVWAQVVVKFEDPNSAIVDWGVPRREGDVIYLDATRGVHGEPNPDGTIGQEGDPDDGNTFHHRYLVWPLDDSGPGGGDDGAVPFRPVEPDPFLIFEEPQEVVLRTHEEWAEWISRHRNPAILAPIVEPPVDWTSEMLVGVFLGPVPLGIWVEIDGVFKTADGLRVHYVTYFGGPPPPEDQIVYPGAMAAVPLTDTPVQFEGSSIAFPSPPPGDPEPAFEDSENDGEDAGEVDGSRALHVVFRIDGVPYARGEFRVPGSDNPDDTAYSEAELKLVEENGELFADVQVLFFGYPYYQVVDWGEARTEDSRVYFDATTAEVQFFVEPELPLVQNHRYALGALDPGLYEFVFRLDGRDAAHAVWISGGEDGTPSDPFEDWLQDLLAGLPASSETPRNLGDLDGDGIPDFAEFALGASPLRGGVPVVKPEYVRDDSGLHLGLRFYRRAASAGIRYVVEGSTDLEHWESLDGALDEAEVRPLGEGMDEVLMCLREPASESPYRYLRLRLTQVGN